MIHLQSGVGRGRKRWRSHGLCVTTALSLEYIHRKKPSAKLSIMYLRAFFLGVAEDERVRVWLCFYALLFILKNK